MQYVCSRERYDGYCLALHAHGVPLDPALVIEGTFETQSGREAARSFFSLPEDQRPTAIFASSDLMAFGVLMFAEEHGISVPNDLALIGFDGIASSSLVRPPLTTVKQPFQEMGQRGTELLLSMIEQADQQRLYVRPDFSRGFTSQPSLSSDEMHKHEQSGSSPLRIQLATSLIVRATCGMQQNVSISSIESSS
jgi:LacI family transcriptional regulator